MLKIILIIFVYCIKNSKETDCATPVQKCGACIILDDGNRTRFSEMENVVQAFVIAMLLMYFFVGISVICDKFMSAIEVMTSATKEVQIKTRDGTIVKSKKKIWNDTVANLTLMALGSSAPEILLAVIEICGKDFKSGDLGPGTIVGSAAFNLFVINGICIMVIPKNECRRIEQFYVFLFTAFSSTFAYGWAYIISVVVSNLRGEIEVWEALVTLSLFPVTVVGAYLLDIKSCCPNNIGRRYEAIKEVQLNHQYSYLASNYHMEDNEVREFCINSIKELRKTYQSTNLLILEDIARFKLHGTPRNSRAYYKMEANKLLTGGKNTWKKKLTRYLSKESKIEAPDKMNLVQHIEFEHQTYIVKEDVGTMYVKVIRSGGNMVSEVKMMFRTIDGTAFAGSDYKKKNQQISFKPFETEIIIPLEIINDEIYEEDEYFTLEIFSLKFPIDNENKYKYVLKEPTVATIIIIDDDHPGVFGFPNATITVEESVGLAIITINRMHGCRGVVHVPFYTEEGTASGFGKEYMDLEGILVFKNDEFMHEISIKIIDCEEYLKEKNFKVILKEPYYDPKGKYVDNPKNIKPHLGNISELKVIITENIQYREIIDRLVNEPIIFTEVEMSNWSDQFRDAFSIVSYEGDEYQLEESPSYFEYVLHFLTLFWKVTFAIVPPTRIYNGWLTFIWSIICIGFLTMVVGDLASLFGCHVGLLDEITSLTFVAIGTSLPDTFASKVAAINEPSADSSVGNVTGSNAVNVYLGLGAAWAIAAIVNKWRDQKFDIKIDTLGFNVTFYFILSSFALAILFVRRHPFIGGELGGKQPYKMISGLILFGLYMLFVIICSLKAYCVINI